MDYRMTTNDTLLRQLSEASKNFSEFARTFYPLYAVVVTWLGVGTVHYEEVSREKTNTFQVLLATDGNQSLVWMEYPKIEWIYDGPVDLFDYNDIVQFTRAQVGFYKGDEITKFLLPVSFSPEVRQIATLSNINNTAIYVFRIDKAPVNVTKHRDISVESMSTQQTSMSTDDMSTVNTFMSTVDMSTQQTSMSTDDMSTVNTYMSRNTILTLQTQTSVVDNSVLPTSETTDDLSTVQTTVSTDYSSTVQTLTSSDDTSTSQASTYSDNMSFVRTTMATNGMSIGHTSSSKNKASTVKPSDVSAGHISTGTTAFSTDYLSPSKTSRISTVPTDASVVTGSSPAATDHSLSDPIVGMSVVCAVLAVMTIVALILVCRLQVKNRRKRFHSRKVGPEEPIEATTSNGQRQTTPIQASPRPQLHSASSLVSTAGIHVLQY